MFYVKEPLKDGVDVTVAINDANVFCPCPVCGRDVPVNLKDVLSDSDADLVGTAVLCDECAEGWMELQVRQCER